MPNPPGFWAALRLTAFVNCEISEANWRTLWSEPPRSFRPAVHPRETAARPGYVPDDLRGAIWASINLEGGRGPREWEVRGAHEGIATLRAIRLQDAEAFIRRRGPIEESPYRPWPRHGRERRGLRYERLKAIHQTTRERLAAVCADAWQPLFKTFGWRRRFHSVATLRFYRHPQFGSVPVLVPDLEPNLELHLDRLSGHSGEWALGPVLPLRGMWVLRRARAGGATISSVVRPIEMPRRPASSEAEGGAGRTTNESSGGVQDVSRAG